MRRWLPLLLLVVAADVASAGIRVEEDEVIFTLRAPGATSVYIVGDFNNWNPTVEPMERVGDDFEIWLFLVPGTYRYKFVVDGRWIVDPENPGDPEKGSFFTLEERPGGYALSTDEPEPERTVAAVTPAVRYIGQLRYDDDDEDVDHIVDVYLSFDRPHLRGSVDLRSLDDTWKSSPPSADVDVSSAFVEVTAGALMLRAFEGDSSWTSRDPVALVGDDGVFHYNAGFERHGAAVELTPSETVFARFMYADRLFDTTAQPAMIAAAGGDTTAYAASRRVAGADQAAVETAIDGSDFAVGYVTRFDRGLHPGVLVRPAADGSGEVYATREDRHASFYWARLKELYGIDVTGGYGRATSHARLLSRGRLPDGAPVDVTAGLATAEADGEVTLAESDRATVSLRRSLSGFDLSASWDQLTVDLEPVTGTPAQTQVTRWTAGVVWTAPRWRAALDGRVTDQDYAGAATDLHVDSPAWNMWLYGRDEFGVNDIAAIGRDRYSDLSLQLEWTGSDAAFVWVPERASAAVSVTGEGVLESLELLVARVSARFAVRDLYAVVDGRMASYDRADWGVKETFASGWVEVGYRRGPVDVNLGYGFDPVVFDPIPGEYADIGHTQFLRGAIASGVRRDEAGSIGARLIGLERELEATHTVKLELVIFL